MDRTSVIVYLRNIFCGTPSVNHFHYLIFLLLVSITLLAMAGGSLAWGILGDHVGRRRALISALSVAALFSAVASVMPTYGTFMTAR